MTTPTPTAPAAIADTLAAALSFTERRLAAFGSEARREARALLEQCLGLASTDLYVNRERVLTASERQRLDEWCQRRASGEPLAYLTGRREFWSLDFAVSPAVLIPRPETEILVETVLREGDRLHRRNTNPPSIVDLGTGSGAIAIAIAHERPTWTVSAVDVSAAALQVATANAARLGVTVNFLHGSWFEPLGDARYDIVVSNPPYVEAHDPVLQGDSLRFEPRLALTPGEDAYAALQSILDSATQHLNANGWLCLEHGANQADELRRRLVARGYAHVVSLPDLAGLDRVTIGRWPTL
jgi:release factor glutamine methyltransferase